MEHIGLGRYGDLINVDGHKVAIRNLSRLVKSGGTFYISFPVGKDEVHFNAHRIRHPSTIMSLDSVQKHLILERFDYVDDDGKLFKDTSINECAAKQLKYGCGIYTFTKK